MIPETSQDEEWWRAQRCLRWFRKCAEQKCLDVLHFIHVVCHSNILWLFQALFQQRMNEPMAYLDFAVSLREREDLPKELLATLQKDLAGEHLGIKSKAGLMSPTNLGQRAANSQMGLLTFQGLRCFLCFGMWFWSWWAWTSLWPLKIMHKSTVVYGSVWKLGPKEML